MQNKQSENSFDQSILNILISSHSSFHLHSLKIRLIFIVLCIKIIIIKIYLPMSFTIAVITFVRCLRSSFIRSIIRCIISSISPSIWPTIFSCGFNSYNSVKYSLIVHTINCISCRSVIIKFLFYK